MSKNNASKIAYALIAAFVIVAVLIAAGLHKSAPTMQVQIVTFGDSCFGNVRDDTSIPTQIGQLTERTVFNAAFGGTCAARKHPDNELEYSLDSLSLTALTKAALIKDFGVQQTMRTESDSSKYFNGVVDALEMVDFKNVETVIIEHGINDCLGGNALENPKDPYDEYTYAGALRTAVKHLRKINPEVQIVFVSPTYFWLNAGEVTCEEYDGGNGNLPAYVQKQKEIAQECGAVYIDLYNDFYDTGSRQNWERYTIDGLHPNEETRMRIAQKIASVLKGEK